MSMTRKEMIERLEQLKRNCHDLAICSPNGKGWALKEMSLSMALTALRGPTREQVEKVWRGKWKISDYDYFCSRCGTGLEDYYIKRFKFCPFCGAPMTDEAVDILLKRLEVLHENNG